MEEILQATVNLIPPAWQYPELTCARIIFQEQEYKTDNFLKTEWIQTQKIIISGEKVGVIDVYYIEEKPEINEGPFCVEERYLINVIAERLGHIIDSKKAEDELKRLNAELQVANIDLERLSQFDGLTTLYNRRYFDAHLKIEWKRHCRNQTFLSLIMCDIDYFKNYNDMYGHHAGDDCLKKVAQAIQKKIKRPSDIACRYGGEEFAIILSETNSDGAIAVAESIKNSIGKLDIPHSASKIKSVVSVSFGVATVIPKKSQSPDTLILFSDKALYQSKEKGRDQVSIA